MLLVDYREGSKELLDPLRRMGLPAETAELESGDIAFEGRGEGGASTLIGLEFKKLDELVGSMRTERLQGHQLLKMQQAYSFNYLLTEGELLYDAHGQLLHRAGRRDLRRMAGGMSVGELLQRLHVLQLRGGLNPIRSRTRQDTLQEIAALYRTWTDRDLDQHKSHIAIYQPPHLTPVSEFRGFVSRFDGISLRKSLAVENHFKGSLKRAINASREEWQKIEGIGPTIAQHVVNVIEGRK
jgi:ERCC4-type nuclease